MGHDHLRKDKECQNCGYTVEVEYCSKCGQKNTETRQSFTHLVAHFAEDFTHYDGAFWKTIKYLIFRPAKLTKEYLEGHRMRYVPPVKLYIFISFVTFLLIGILSDKEYLENEESGSGLFKVENKTTTEKKDSKEMNLEERIREKEYNSLKEMDSIEKTLPKEQRMNYISYTLSKAAFKAEEMDKKNVKAEIFVEAFTHILPKVLFIYMPIFTFWLWLFHSKKRWYFFDHGIFTLHFFSLLLLLLLIIRVLTWSLSHISETIYSYSYGILPFLLFVYSLFYFFRSHRIMYGENKAISRLKSSFIFIINTVCIAIVLLASMIYVMLNMH